MGFSKLLSGGGKVQYVVNCGRVAAARWSSRGEGAEACAGAAAAAAGQGAGGEAGKVLC